MVLLVLFDIGSPTSGCSVHFRNRRESPVLFLIKPDGGSRNVLFEMFDRAGSGHRQHHGDRCSSQASPICFGVARCA
jgi:hypothetical protein